MELDELKSAWQSTHSRLDDVQAIQLAMQRTSAQTQSSVAKKRLMVAPVFELVVSGLTLLWSGNFLWENQTKIQNAPAGALPVAALYALAIFTVWLSIRSLILIAELDYSKPIVEAQKHIANLRSLRVRSTQFTMLMGLPLWVILPLLLGQVLLGYDFVRAVNPTWLLANLAFGVAASLGIVLAARNYGEQSPFFRKINDLLAGTEITDTQQFLAELEEFKQA